MRHVLFAIVLVGASFLGGAFVNGPGMKWLQVKVLGHAGMGDDVPSITVPAASVAGDDPGPSPGKNASQPPSIAEAGPSPKGVGQPPVKTAANDGKRGSSSTAQAPARPADGAPRPEPESEPAGGGKSGFGNVLGSLLSLGGGGDGDRPPARSGSPAKGPESAGAGPAESLRSRAPLPEPREPSKTPIALASRRAQAPGAGGSAPIPEPEPMPKGPGRPAPLDPSVTPAFLASLGSPASTSARVPVSQASSASPPSAEPVPLPLPISISDEPVSAQASASSAAPGPAPAPAAGADEWGAIRRKLRAIGVSRYTIEGEPGGRVSFSCLIPLAGRQAVTQRFEAEGDDEIRAARAALRRIALWQATERDRPAR